MNPVTVVGAGNWMLSHDRIGPDVLQRLDGRFDPHEVELCTVGGHGLGLLDHLRGQDLLLVVDACVNSGGAPGQVQCVAPDLASTPARESSVHQIGPVEALVVASRLTPELLPRRIRLLLVETDGLDDAQQERACAGVVEAVDREVGAWRRRRGERSS